MSNKRSSDLRLYWLKRSDAAAGRADTLHRPIPYQKHQSMFEYCKEQKCFNCKFRTHWRTCNPQVNLGRGAVTRFENLVPQHQCSAIIVHENGMKPWPNRQFERPGYCGFVSADSEQNSPMDPWIKKAVLVPASAMETPMAD